MEIAEEAPKDRRARLIASRTMLMMLLIAAVVVLALGLASLALVDPPEVDGWLRSAFGRVFGVVAIGLAAVLGIPSAVGLWALLGAGAPDVVPALPPLARRVMAGVAIATVTAAAISVIASGSASFVLNLALVALVALASLGLAGAVSWSPHRGRAILAAIALAFVAAGTVWVLTRELVAPAA